MCEESKKISDDTHGWYWKFLALKNVQAGMEKYAETQAQKEKEKCEKEEKVKAVQAAHHKELMETAVPKEALAAYNECGGDPDRLHDDIDNPGYWLVKKYGEAIEAQGLSKPDAKTIKKMLSEMSREAMYGINDTGE